MSQGMCVRGVITLNPEETPIKVSDVLMNEPFEGFEVTGYGHGEVNVKLWIQNWVEDTSMESNAVGNCINPLINRLALHGISCTKAEYMVYLLEPALDLTVVVEVSRPEPHPLTAFGTGLMKCVDMVELKDAVDREIRGAMKVFQEQYPAMEELRWEFKEHGMGHYIPVEPIGEPRVVPFLDDYGLWVGHTVVTDHEADVSPKAYVEESLEHTDGLTRQDIYNFLREFYTEETTQTIMEEFFDNDNE